MFSARIYGSWKAKQWSKYEQVFPQIKPFLSDGMTFLDYGIGKAWFEDFFRAKEVFFSRVLGYDISEEAVCPRKDGIEYCLSPKLSSREQFDFVVCFDAYHLAEENPLSFVKPGGLFLVSLPLRWWKTLDDFKGERVLAQGEIGIEEKDYFLLIEKANE